MERISERFLIPVLEAILETFPFAIHGFHADNGSEYINHRVAALLNKLHIEFTKSRPRHCNDNALAESKNASVIRKHFGYQHIPGSWPLAQLNDLHRRHFNPYLNFHRPPLPAPPPQGNHPPEPTPTTAKSLPEATRFLQTRRLLRATGCIRSGSQRQ